jgi:hypothetical protein
MMLKNLSRIAHKSALGIATFYYFSVKEVSPIGH